MIKLLRNDADFSAKTKSRLEEFFDSIEGAEMIMNAKFWCNLAWIENLWCDAKRQCKGKCDNTLPTLKRNFPLAIKTACPPDRLRTYMQKCIEHIEVLNLLGRNGDFSQFGALAKKQKKHRDANMVRFGVKSERAVRSRKDWGHVSHARRTAAAATSAPADDVVVDDDNDDDEKEDN